MRLIYSFLFFLLIPVALLRLYILGFSVPERRKRWLERLGIYHRSYTQQVIWFHAVSVGEAEAAFPLIKLIQLRHPDANLLITTMTPTGSARVLSVLGSNVAHVYLPYDIPFIVSRFLTTFKPKLAIIMEKEIWPNLYAQCGNSNIPLFIINARLSKNSAKNYKNIPSLVIPALNHVRSIMTQTEEDCDHFIAIGAHKNHTHVQGNIKFDISTPKEIFTEGKKLKEHLFPNRFVWIIASTHKGEDEIFMDIYKNLKKGIPELALLIVPRHPERAQQITRLAKERHLTSVQRSLKEPYPPQTDIYIADTIGELKLFYSSADVAFVGGSMTPIGGHNILEPIAIGLPVLFGPYMGNFKEIAHNGLIAQAAVQCNSSNELCEIILELYNSTEARQNIIAQGAQFLKANQGALGRIYNELKIHI